MNTKVLPILLLLLSSIAISVTQAAESPDIRTCNQLGREVALRAVEDQALALDSSQRAALASLTEEVCRNFQLQNPELSSQQTGAQEGVLTKSAPEEDQLFDLKKIDQRDRVKRPGLKRL